MDWQHLAAARGGIISLRELTRLGLDRPSQRRFVRAHRLARVRDGWYAASGADPAALAAVRAGGALTCIHVTGAAGAWKPLGVSTLHVRFAAASDRRRSVERHVPLGDRVPVTRAIDDLSLAVTCMSRCQPTGTAVAVLDSLLRRELMLPGDVANALAAAGRQGLELAARVDPSAESGTESHLRLILRAMGIRFVPQVRIRGVGRVDFLVGDRLVIEADGIEHHDGDAVQVDRDRDNALHQLGFHCLRFTYADVLGRPEHVRATVLAALARREQRWTRRTKLWERSGAPDPVLGQEVPWIVEAWQASRPAVQFRRNGELRPSMLASSAFRRNRTGSSPQPGSDRDEPVRTQRIGPDVRAEPAA